VTADPLGVLARRSRTFSLAARLLPADLRRDAAIVYAFCRHVDDLADDAPSADAGLVALDRLDRDLRDGRSDDSRVARYLAVARRRGLDVAWGRELVAGGRSDLGSVRIPTDDALVRYSYRVGGTVALSCSALLGAGPEARPFATDLGIAMQITHICRDVREDAGGDRVYLPSVRLHERGISPDDVLFGRADRRALAAVVLDLLDLADRYYASARHGVRHLPPAVRPAILAAADLYRGIGTILRDRGGDAWAGRAVVRRKGRVVAGALLGTMTPDVLGLGRPAQHDPALHAAL
jgi:phytoene synthase